MDNSVLVSVVLLVVAYIWYAKIITNKNTVLESLAGIDAQQKKRSNLVPNLLVMVKKFMQHESALLLQVTELRAQTDKSYDKTASTEVCEHLQALQSLDANLGKLMIAVENYPELKSQENMLHAQRAFEEAEEQIAAARRFYNASVSSLNNLVQIFPGNVFALLARVESMPFYKADPSDKKPVNAGEYLN